MAGIVIGVYFNFPNRSIAMSSSQMRENKLRQIINYINYDYVDKLNTDSLLDLTIADLVQKLDPHSTYIPVDQVAENEEEIKGSFDGIGIEFKIYKDTLTVMRVIENGPAEKAGLKAGDRILKASGKLMYGKDINTNTIVSTLKGPSGSKVALNIFRPYQNKHLLARIKRGEVELKSVPSYFMLNANTGYIKLIRFSQNSDDEVERALEKLKQQGASQLILDLRDNPGGLLQVARQVADEFLPGDMEIVMTKDRQGDKQVIKSSQGGEFKKGPLVVLIDEGSASASEIVAGALQDNDRAWIIGRRSFGKGLVQEEITLNDGSKLRLTTRRYYTPSGRSIQKPFEDYDKRFLAESGYQPKANDHFGNEDPSVIFHTLSGREVYGGGGIMPDVMVPLDTSHAAAVLYHISMIENLDAKAFEYVDKHRDEFAEMSKKDFIRNFKLNDTLTNTFLGTVSQSMLRNDPIVTGMIKSHIKALIAYNLYGNAAFQQAYADEDPALSIALQTLNEKPFPVAIKK